MRWHVGRQTVIHGDAFEVLRDLPMNEFDVVVTSPQYNLNVGYAATDDNLPWDAYLGQIRIYAGLLRRVLKPDGSLFLVLGHSCLEPWVAYDAASQFRERFVLQNRMVWVKSLTVGERSYGHFKPINSKRFVNDLYEEVFHFTPEGDVQLDRLSVGVPYEDKTNIARWDTPSGDLRCRGNVWFIPYATITSRRCDRWNHPATFPVQLAEWCIRLHGVKDSTKVLDPMVGTGSTLVAAEAIGVTGVGVDICLDYCRTSVDSLRSYVEVGVS